MFCPDRTEKKEFTISIAEYQLPVVVTVYSRKDSLSSEAGQFGITASFKFKIITFCHNLSGFYISNSDKIKANIK